MVGNNLTGTVADKSEPLSTTWLRGLLAAGEWTPAWPFANTRCQARRGQGGVALNDFCATRARMNLRKQTVAAGPTRLP